MIKIKHPNGTETHYAHLSEINVIPGQQIKRGFNIGAVGSTGFSTGPHLHFEVWINSQPVNPEKFLNKPTQIAEIKEPEITIEEIQQGKPVLRSPEIPMANIANFFK